MSGSLHTKCDTCHTRITWIECPTGGWWAHDIHPLDNHDAVTRLVVDEIPDVSGWLITIGMHGDPA